MSPATQALQLFVVAGLGFLVMGSLLTAALVRGLGDRLSDWEPRTRHRILLVMAALPLVLAGLCLLSAALPAFIALVLPGFDHCLDHPDTHAHLCFVHPPHVALRGALTAGLVALSVTVGLRSAMGLRRLHRGLGLARALIDLGHERPDLGVTLIDSEAPICLTVGVWRPQVVVSRDLHDTLTEQQRAVVLAHERAHVVRRDALTQIVARALTCLHLPATGRWILTELAIAAEQACDEAAAERVEDRLAVAQTILHLEAIIAAHTGLLTEPSYVAFGGTAIERRVEALLTEARPPASLRRPLAASLVALTGVLASSLPLHHVTESLVSWLAV